jgi:hypothetical protein
LSDHDHNSAYSALAHDHDSTYINASGDTMTGALTLSGAPSSGLHAATKTYVDTADAAAFKTNAVEATSLSWNSVTTPGIHPKLMHGTQNPNGPGSGVYYYVTVYQYAGANLTQVAYPYTGTGSGIVYRDRYSGAWSAWQETATEAYVGTQVDTRLPLTGGTLSARLQIDTGEGLTLHYPGNSVVSLGAQLIGGRYTLEVLDGWNANSGSYAPIQAGTPINGSSAVTVDWVRTDRAAVSHGNHPATWATAVVTASSGGNATVYGGSFSIPVMCNGDSNAQPNRPVGIHDWWNNGFTSNGWNPGACRVNWIGC